MPRSRSLTLILAVGAVLLVPAARAGAQEIPSPISVAVSTSQPDPVAGEPVTYTATPSGGNGGPFDYHWFVDGTPAGTNSPTLTTSFPTVSSGHSVAVNVTDEPPVGERVGSGQISPINVLAPLSGSIGASTDTPTVGQSVQFTATAAGGKSPLSIFWNLDGSGFGQATGPTVTTSFSMPGAHTVQAEVIDSAQPAHTLLLAHTVTVAGAPPSPAPPCVQKVDFALAEVTTDGCLTNVGTDAAPRWQTTSPTKLNGIPLPAPPAGTFLVAIPPTPGHPGGQIQLQSAKIDIAGLTVFQGSIDWSLPAGTQGNEATVLSLKVPPAQAFKGLKVGGSIAFRLGWAANGTHYATFPLQIQLPDIFKSGPTQQSGGVTATGSLRVDLNGIHYDGLKLEVKNVYVGRLKVQSACFSYVPAGGQSVAPCAPLTLGGSPFLTCNTNVNTDRWDGNALLVLPTASKTQLGLFGGVANDRLSSLGGFVDKLGTTVPIVEGVFLNRVGVGLCVYPPPFKLKGVVGVSVLPTAKGATVGVNGYFLYTDPFAGQPWSLELGGDVSVFDNKLGSGRVIIRPTGSLDFDLQAGFKLAGVVTVNGTVVGWIEAHRHTFSIDGTVRACIRRLCATAEGLVSSTGVAGCLDLGHITIYELKRNHNWHWYTPWRVHWESHTISLQAGFGHRWSQKGVSLFGDSCDLGNYAASRSQAGGSSTFRVSPGEPAVAVRIAGAGGPPHVALRGPGGVSIAPPAADGARRGKGYVIVENPSDNSTSVLLIHPRPGRWTLRPLPGSRAVTAVAVAGFAPPAALSGAVQPQRGGREVVSVAYAAPRDVRIELVERGGGTQHVIAARLHGRACPGPKRPGGQPLRCALVSFRPATGARRTRAIYAVLTRAGQPAGHRLVARFTAPRQHTVGRPARLRAARAGADVIVAWRPAAHAGSQTLSVTLSSGREFGLAPSARCGLVRLVGVGSDIAVHVSVSGLDALQNGGPAARVDLAAGAQRAGAHGTLRGTACATG